MLKSLTRIFFILLGADVLLFFCLMGTSVSDQQALPIAGTFYWVLQCSGLSAGACRQQVPLFPGKHHLRPGVAGIYRG